MACLLAMFWPTAIAMPPLLWNKDNGGLTFFHIEEERQCPG